MPCAISRADSEQMIGLSSTQEARQLLKGICVTIKYHCSILAERVSCSCSIHPLLFLLNVFIVRYKWSLVVNTSASRRSCSRPSPILTWSATTDLSSKRQTKSLDSSPSLLMDPEYLAESGCSKWQTSSLGLCISQSGNVDQRTVLLEILELLHSMVLSRNFCDSHLSPLYRSSPRVPSLSQYVNTTAFVPREASGYQPAVLTRVPVHTHCLVDFV